MLSSFSPFPSLPAYRGPHQVGSAEYEVPLSTIFPDQISPPVSTVKFRIFYPAQPQPDSTRGTPWIPEPQSLYINAYLKLGRVSGLLSSFARTAAWAIRGVQIPAYGHAPLLKGETPRPVLIYTHGLTCSMNTNSAMLGELASRGFVCIAIEHRDGSAPVSVVRSETGDESHLYWRNVSMKVRPHVLVARDEQLKLRIFEMMAACRILELINEGSPINNLAGPSVNMQKSLQLSPGSVAWVGYSFGGSTLTQFIKSIYYHDDMPTEAKEALLVRAPSASLKAQITAQSPITLLDPWFMPLKSPATQFLYEKPLPCHQASAPATTVSTAVVMSSEAIWTWPQCHCHLPAFISLDPRTIEVETQEAYEESLRKYPTPAKFMAASKKDVIRKATLEKQVHGACSDAVDLYVLSDVAHTTFCDYGLVLQWLSYFMAGQKDPVAATENVVRCILKTTGDTSDSWTSLPTDLNAADTQIQHLP